MSALPPFPLTTCSCPVCMPRAQRHRRIVFTALSRSLVLLAVVCAVPFILANALAGIGGDRR